MAESEPERAFAINRDGAGRLAATARLFRVPFVHVSTDYVFDGCKASPYYESDDPYPLGAYGQSKLEGEKAVMSENPEAIVFRTSWVYSPYGTNFLKTMLHLAETQRCRPRHKRPARRADRRHRSRGRARRRSHANLRKRSPGKSRRLSRYRVRRRRHGTALPGQFSQAGAIAAIVFLSLKRLRQPIIQLA